MTVNILSSELMLVLVNLTVKSINTRCITVPGLFWKHYNLFDHFDIKKVVIVIITIYILSI